MEDEPAVGVSLCLEPKLTAAELDDEMGLGEQIPGPNFAFHIGDHDSFDEDEGPSTGREHTPPRERLSQESAEILRIAKAHEAAQLEAVDHMQAEDPWQGKKLGRGSFQSPTPERGGPLATAPSVHCASASPAAGFQGKKGRPPSVMPKATIFKDRKGASTAAQGSTKVGSQVRSPAVAKSNPV